jgi:hypothetical protein
MYLRLKWLLPYDLYFYNLMCFVYTNIHNINPCAYFSNVFTSTFQIHNYETRMNKSLYVPNVRLSNYGKRCISFAAAMKWNGLPAEIEAAPSLRVFKRRIKTHLLCYYLVYNFKHLNYLNILNYTNTFFFVSWLTVCNFIQILYLTTMR